MNTESYDKFIEQMQAGIEEYNEGMEKYQAAIQKVKGTSVVKGKVIIENGEPLIGATVASVDKRYGTTTDLNGEFTLNLPNYVSHIKVSYVGYQDQVLAVEPYMSITMGTDELTGTDHNELSDLFLRVPKKDKSLTPNKPDAKDWMKKLLFYVEKIQQPGDRYLYLSKLYELCKDTDGLDQMDLKIAMQQLASVYKQLKEKKKLKENELLFLESMVDLIHSKIKN